MHHFLLVLLGAFGSNGITKSGTILQKLKLVFSCALNTVVWLETVCEAAVWTDMEQAATGCSGWKKPAAEQPKCNVDASFPNHDNTVGIGTCIRDEFDAFVDGMIYSKVQGTC